MVHKHYWMRALGAVWLSCLTALGAWAQTGTSRVTGVLEDNAGAVVPGAKVTLTNEGTNASLTTTSTSAGAYVF
ncbi:MAG TPA: carboxypeptidase-like regulatory domain-containing protein, partial [Blastocatellia bacterium]|nr:carboxypeptidase-like regulatory domain-containing protein [Blastocatellia bacterium]